MMNKKQKRRERKAARRHGLTVEQYRRRGDDRAVRRHKPKEQPDGS